jgi:hypothetical protein
MIPSHDERRYSDEEFALILRTASEGRGRPETTTPQEGLTLSEILGIAAEVGIDPEGVSKAAALLPSGEVTTMIRLIGGPPRHRLEHRVPGEVPAKGLGRLVDVARRVLDTQGESREVLRGLEWSGGTATTSARVTVTPRDGETILQASIDGTEAMAREAEACGGGSGPSEETER